MATGASPLPEIPAAPAPTLAPVPTLSPQYRDPGQFSDGGVLVVGASATGVQSPTSASGRSRGDPRGGRTRPCAPLPPRPRHPLVAEASGRLDERYDEIDDRRPAGCLPCSSRKPGPATRTQHARPRGSASPGAWSGSRGAWLSSRVPSPTPGPRRPEAAPVLEADRRVARRPDPRRPAPAADRADTVHPRCPPELDLTSGEITTVLWATGSGPTTPGSPSRYGPQRSPPPRRRRRTELRASTSSVCPCSAPAPPPTSTAQPPTPKPWPATCTRSSAAWAQPASLRRSAGDSAASARPRRLFMDPVSGQRGPDPGLACVPGQAQAVRAVREHVHGVRNLASRQRRGEAVGVLGRDVGILRRVPAEKRAVTSA